MSAEVQNPAHNKTLFAIGLILAANAIGPFIDVLAKHLGQTGMPVFEIVWARFAFGTLFTLPFAISAGKVASTANLKLNALRALCLVFSTYSFFAALKYLPIADTLSIYFVQPLLVTVLSPLVLREQVGWKKWVVVFAGFCGVLIIIRPGFQGLNIGQLFAFLSGLSSAINLLVARFSKGQINPIISTFQTSLIAALAMTALTPGYWQVPQLEHWGFFMALGAIAASSLYLITRAYDHAEASLLSPLNYTEMIPAVICGWLFFGDFPDRYTFLGVGILIACAIQITRSARHQQAAEAAEAAEAAIHP